MADLLQQKPGSIRIICVLLPRFNMHNLTGLLEPSRIANYLSEDPLYVSSFHSVDGDVITASNGFTVTCTTMPEDLSRDDIVMVLGSWGSEHYRNPALFSWLRMQARRGIRLCAIDISAYIFARCGLLNGKKTTLHWSCLSGFQERFPEVDTVEQLFTIDGKILSCSGGTAVIDLMFHLIESAHGAPLAAEVSDQMVHHPFRPATSRQRFTLSRGNEALTAEVRATVELIESNISEPLSVPEIAVKIGLSQRQLIRDFSKAMGCSIVKFGVLARLQHARVLLVTTRMTIREISTASGFNSLSHFAFAFKKCFGKRPSDYRQAWPEQDDEPHWPGTLMKYRESLRS